MLNEKIKRVTSTLYFFDWARVCETNTEYMKLDKEKSKVMCTMGEEEKWKENKYMNKKRSELFVCVNCEVMFRSIEMPV